MKLEEDASWPGKAEQLFVELWFHLPEKSRIPIATSLKAFYRDLMVAVDPMTLGSMWNPVLQLWTHEISEMNLRIIYTARRDHATGEWIAMIDSFYLTDKKQT